jgi:hypothetical protein
LPAERRASARLPVEMWVEDLTDGGQVFRRAGNFSRGGLHLDFSIPIPVGSPVKLRFALPGGEPITISGRVASIDTSEEFGMGIAFVDVAPDVQSRLDAFIDERLAATPAPR